MAAKCCAPIAACERDPECQTVQRCALDCQVENDAGGCYQGCLDAHPSARPAWDPVYDCWYAAPPAGCGVECTYLP
jgi:hypothetical protein